MSNMTNQVDEYVNYSKQKKSQNNRSAKICLDYIDNNNQLSWTAKGIFIYLASRPTEDISIKDICDVSQDSLGYVEVGLKELERAKLLYILDTTEKATGKQRQSQMFIFNRPTSKKEAIKEISKKYNLNINDGEENMTTENYISYDVCDEPMFIHKCIMDQFFKTNYPSELLSLYLFYYYQEKYNGFETNGISVKEISKIFSWPLEKTKKIKDLMFSLDLRTPY